MKKSVLIFLLALLLTGCGAGTVTIDGIEYDYTYSDANMMIERKGVRYYEALDPLNSCREYVETDEPFANDEEATEVDYQNALARFGVEVLA